LEDLYEHAPCGYHAIDANGTFVRVNANELGWLGYSLEEVVGKKAPTDFFTAEGKERFRRNFPRRADRAHLRAAAGAEDGDSQGRGKDIALQLYPQ
jgi:PAS domain S-box-containing protein